MTFPIQITFRDMEPAPSVENWIQAEAKKLDTFYGRIVDCRVAVSVPHRHHRKGKPVHVRVDLIVPGKEIVVNREPVVTRRSNVPTYAAVAPRLKRKAPHADLQAAIREAFKAAARRLQDYARRERGDVKRHALAS
jgi:ribosome-associated translation inhibitor RaiA